MDAFLQRFGGDSDGPWLFDRFGWAECVFAPFFRRFAFVSYYEGVDLPDEPAYSRVRAWREACLAHPAAQQTCEEEVVKLYYEYARGGGNGGLDDGRAVSSFALPPDAVPWPERLWPPKDKYGEGATDEAMGLVATASS